MSPSVSLSSEGCPNFIVMHCLAKDSVSCALTPPHIFASPPTLVVTNLACLLVIRWTGKQRYRDSLLDLEDIAVYASVWRLFDLG